MLSKENRQAVILTWNDVDNLVWLIAERLKPHKKQIKKVYGIPRGGLIVAVILSHKLGLKLVTNKSEITEDTLVVDDISDSGETLKDYTDDGKFLSATLFTLKDSKFKPTVTGDEKSSSCWIYYPWESKESSKKDN